MMDRSDNDGLRRPGTRPFVGGQPSPREEARTFAYAPPRPFSYSGARRPSSSQTSTSSLSVATPQKSPTPLWTVAVYEPRMDATARYDEPGRVLGDRATEDVVNASLALADDVIEAQRHASSMAAAEVLETVAHKLRRGEILLLPGASTQTEAAVVSSVLAVLLGGRR